ncbi:hypothetical protein LCM00_12700 [Bacillus infantis]|uniref:hypothetical protein n=1 Tax=Bacillus infantis TaxID=324767 RepID=UPI001CD5D1BE|nr:hypothetical protein [Bacillus infantis]MCA1040365.1 hypothetical protein [Bacillus infantis]
MNEWKEAMWLVKFEMGKSARGFIQLIFNTVLFLVVSILAFSLDLSKTAIVDFMFVVLFGFSAAWSRTKDFQTQRVQADVWASPYFMTLSQLPIGKGILVKSRFLTYFLTVIPAQLIFMILLYSFSPSLNSELGMGGFTAFSLMWLAFSIFFGLSFPAMEAGDIIKRTNLVIYSIMLYGGGLAAVILFNTYSSGLVGWTIMAAGKWPLLTSLLAIAAAAACTLFYKKYMLKKMAAIDYLS